MSTLTNTHPRSPRNQEQCRTLEAMQAVVVGANNSLTSTLRTKNPKSLQMQTPLLIGGHGDGEKELSHRNVPLIHPT